MNPAPYTWFKKRGAMRLSAIPPKEESSPTKDGKTFKSTKAGALLLEVAPPVPNVDKKYDWNNKVVLAINELEIVKLMMFKDKEIKLYHDTGKGTDREGQKVKGLWAQKQDSDKGMGYTFTLTEKIGDKTKKATITLGAEEYRLLQEFLRAGLLYVNAWVQ